jgi:Outer membrane protein beta-barrel family/Carboxypeptidase regulatory-like domain
MQIFSRFLIIFLLLFSHSLFAQYVTIRGTVIDTQRSLPISNATISAIRAKDSALITFTRTKADGSYSMQVADSTMYNILVAHPGYASYQDEVNATNTNINTGNIGLVNRSQMLQAIVVRQKGSIRIKGDTTIYLADSFKVDENATVEDLLKVLPGMQVDKNGNIMTQGEQVQKVLVDGEEFFGDDPTVATQNLQAKTIDKVEVFDNKSEQAKFTGFDDGQREKTINLKMKANMNKGVFGKVQGGTNLGQIWDNSVMASAFKNKRKISIYGINSSRGTSGLNWNDRERFGGNSGSEFMSSDDGMYMVSSSSDDESGMNFNGEGLPKVNNMGVHYSNKWLENKYALNVNGNLRENFINKTETNNQSNYIGNSVIATNTIANSYANRKNVKLGSKFEYIIDTSSSLVLFVDASQTNTETMASSNTINKRDSSVASTSNRQTNNTGIAQNASIDVSYKKRLKKIGRTASINTNWAWKQNTNDGLLVGANNFITKNEVLDQQKKINNNTINGSLRTVYTEPLFADKVFAEINYAFNINQNNQNKTTRIKATAGDDYTQQVDSLSNTFYSNIVGNTAGIKLMYKIRKFNINAGTNVKHTIFHQEDLIRIKNYDYSRINILPTANISYKISSQQNIRVSYNGSTNQPSIFQLQNVVDNTDPLNIQIGNPNVKQEFRQSINVNYWNYQTLSDRSFNASIWFSNTFNAISRIQTFENNTGRTINTYTNLSGRFNIGAWSNASAKLGSSNFTAGATFRPSYNRNPIVVNGITSFGNNFDATIGTELRYAKKKKIDLNIEIDWSRNSYSNTTLGQKNNYFSITPNIDADIYITKRCVFSTNAEYQWRQKNAVFPTDFTRLLWNAGLGYRFLPQKNVEAKIMAKDILNQNNGYTRNAYGNNISERTNNSLRRYVLLTVIYNFSIGPINKLPKDDDDE